MSFFTGSTHSAPSARIKQTPWGSQTIGSMQQTYNTGYNRSAAETASMNILNQIQSGQAMPNPSNDPRYANFRTQANQNIDNGMQAIRRGNQLAGAGSSSVGGDIVSDYVVNAENKVNALLSDIYARQMAVDNPYTRMQAGLQAGNLDRRIASDKMNAGNQILNYQPWYQPQVYSSPSEWSQVASVGGSLAGGLGMLMMASDIRLKDQLTLIEGPLKIPGCRWFKWVWNEAGNSLGYFGEACGLLAQEVEIKYPDCIVNIGEYLAIDYGRLLTKLFGDK